MRASRNALRFVVDCTDQRPLRRLRDTSPRGISVRCRDGLRCVDGRVQPALRAEVTVAGDCPPDVVAAWLSEQFTGAGDAWYIDGIRAQVCAHAAANDCASWPGLLAV